MDETKPDRIDECFRQVESLVKLNGGTLDVPEPIKSAMYLAWKRAIPKILTEAEMEVLILKLLAERASDGLGIIKRLKNANFELKTKGDGLLYGILANLESAKKVESEWREVGSSMVKIYRITDKGGNYLRKSESTCAGLGDWLKLLESPR